MSTACVDIYDCIRTGDVSGLHQLLHDCPIDALLPDAGFADPLTVAVTHNQLECAKLLLHFGKVALVLIDGPCDLDPHIRSL